MDTLRAFAGLLVGSGLCARDSGIGGFRGRGQCRSGYPKAINEGAAIAICFELPTV